MQFLAKINAPAKAAKNKPLTRVEKDAVERWFGDHCSTPDCYDRRSEWEDAMYAMMDKDDDTSVSMCADELGIKNWSAIADIFAAEAKYCISVIDPEDYDCDYDDEDYDEDEGW